MSLIKRKRSIVLHISNVESSVVHPHLSLILYTHSSFIFACIINFVVSDEVGVDELACSINTDRNLLASDC